MAERPKSMKGKKSPLKKAASSKEDKSKPKFEFWPKNKDGLSEAAKQH